MVAAAPTWPGSPDELTEFLAIVRDGCRECGRNRTFHSPCRNHIVDAVLALYNQKDLGLLVGQKHDPYWQGPQDRGVCIRRKED